MQAYNQGFARIFNTKWSAFARQVAPLILGFYATTPLGQENKSVLDLCCGTGHSTVCFLEKGYKVVAPAKALRRESVAPEAMAGGVIVVEPPKQGGPVKLVVTINGQQHKFTFAATPSA